MPSNFKLYRIVCSTPPELEEERLVVEAAVGAFNEQVAMPEGVLYAAASLPPHIDAVRARPDIDANIRMCEYFLQIFGETWPDPVFQHFVEYAADPASLRITPEGARGIAVLFRNYEAAAEEVRRFRESLSAGGRCELRDFRDGEELARVLREQLQAWHNPIGLGNSAS